MAWLKTPQNQHRSEFFLTQSFITGTTEAPRASERSWAVPSAANAGVFISDLA